MYVKRRRASLLPCAPGRDRARPQGSHARILEVAARAISRTGYGGTGVADIMQEAGLTHGGFYAHFASREAMLAEAADGAGAEAVAALARIAAAVPPQQALQSLVRAYMSKTHVEAVETGCAAALGSEMPRQAPEVRRASTRRIKEQIDLVARSRPNGGSRARTSARSSQWQRKSRGGSIATQSTLQEHSGHPQRARH